MYPNRALGAASVAAGEGKLVALLFKALQDVVPFRDVMSDGETLLAPVNGDSVAEAHKDPLTLPCYILTCPI